MHPVIQVSGVRKTYGTTVAVEEASFEVNQGEIFGLIGPNGAGKTTTMECVEGIRKPDRGTIAVLGLDPFRQVYKLQDRIGVQLPAGTVAEANQSVGGGRSLGVALRKEGRRMQSDCWISLDLPTSGVPGL